MLFEAVRGCRRGGGRKSANEQDLSQVEAPTEDGVLSGCLFEAQLSLIFP